MKGTAFMCLSRDTLNNDGFEDMALITPNVSPFRFLVGATDRVR